MKNFFLTVFLSLFLGSALFGQTDTVKIEKSTDKVIIGGQVYYVHIVKKGETLYSLSKAYEVSQKDIAKENPEIFLGLIIGQALKIPHIKSDKVNEDQEDTQNFIYHRVKKSQTLYSLSRKYDVSQEEIIKYNPSVKYGITIDQIIKIPKKGYVAEDVTVPQTKPFIDTIKLSDQYIYHDVKPKETIYSLVRLYNLSEELLYDLNPFLSDGLKIGQVLKIPKVQEPVDGFVFENITAQAKDSVVYEKRSIIAYSDSVKYNRCDSIRRKITEPFDVAVLLPFYIDNSEQEYYIDSSKTNEFGKKIYETVYRSPNYIYPRAVNFVEFYEGILLAVDSLKSNGFSVNLHVYDTQGDTNVVKNILLKPQLKNVDLIIGPVYSNEVEVVSRFSMQHGIKMVSPLSDNLSLTETNPYIFQVSPGFSSQFDEMAKASSSFKDKNIVLLHNIDSLQHQNISILKEKLFNYYSIDTTIKDLQFKEVFFTDSIQAIEHALKKSTENIVLVPSNDQAFVSLVVSNLNSLSSKGYSIKTFGMSRWYRFGNIDPEYFYALNTHLVIPFYIDFKDQKVKEFIKKYRKLFKSEPDQYVMHGFDVGMYFFTALQKYGVDFQDCIYHHHTDQLQADFKFVKWFSNSGYENIGMSIVRYDKDYTINLVKDNKLQKNQSFSNH
ncbi:MAG: LysM peptidoglycan-binding domain-containing protein [Bacteroidales bacterium]|nr:LysM peptidoglycan-binding domain-containing protein [Bacteroidales bacterium]